MIKRLYKVMMVMVTVVMLLGLTATPAKADDMMEQAMKHQLQIDLQAGQLGNVQQDLLLLDNLYGYSASYTAPQAVSTLIYLPTAIEMSPLTEGQISNANVTTAVYMSSDGTSIIGTAAPGSEVELETDTHMYLTVVADSSGGWEIGLSGNDQSTLSGAISSQVVPEFWEIFELPQCPGCNYTGGTLGLQLPGIVGGGL